MAEPDREAYEAAERLVREAHGARRGGRARRRDGTSRPTAGAAAPAAAVERVPGPERAVRAGRDAERHAPARARPPARRRAARAADRDPRGARLLDRAPRQPAAAASARWRTSRSDEPAQRSRRPAEGAADCRRGGRRARALARAALVPEVVLPGRQGRPGQRLARSGVFTFVEGAILLVAVAVCFLVWARSQQKGFHLPGGDGVAITLAGGWAVLLLVCRLFDQPDIQGAGATIGIQWGIFGALLAAGALIAAGARVRAVHAPEPPNPAADDVDWVHAPRRERERPPDRRPRDATAVTEVLRERPAWEGEPPTDARRTTPPGRRRSRARRDDAPARRPLARRPPGCRTPSEAPTRRERRADRPSASGRTTPRDARANPTASRRSADDAET